MYVDSHAHLDAAEFAADRDAVIARAAAAGLHYVLLIADLTRDESVATARELAEKHDGYYWAAGIDPHEAASAGDDHLERLARLSQHPQFLAVGEIGLDYYYDYPRDAQKRVFLRQLDLARQLRRPVIIHCRDAWSDMRAILREQMTSARLGGQGAGILHCFTGTGDDARDLVNLGFYVSFAANLTFKRAENLRQAARQIPLDRLLTETDSPFLAPVPHRGQRNEPAYVTEVTRTLGEIAGLSALEMGRRAAENFERLFALPVAGSEGRGFSPAVRTPST